MSATTALLEIISQDMNEKWKGAATQEPEFQANLCRWQSGLEFVVSTFSQDNTDEQEWRKQEQSILNQICAPILLDQTDRVSIKLKLISFKLVTLLPTQFHSRDGHLDRLFLTLLKEQAKLLDAFNCSYSYEVADSFVKEHLKDLPLLRQCLKFYPVMKSNLEFDTEAKAKEELKTILKNLVVLGNAMEGVNTTVFTSIGLALRLLDSDPLVETCIENILHPPKLGKPLAERISKICIISDALFEPTNATRFINDDFWCLLREGLQSIENLLQKQSLYLMKRAVNGVLNNLFKIQGQHKLFQTLPSSFPKQKRIWEDFFLIYESIDEKQVHIIKQITSRLNSLLSEITEDFDLDRMLHVSWLLVLVKVLFRHQNAAIIKWTLHYFLNSFQLKHLEMSSSDELLNFVGTDLLSAMNNTKGFQRDTEEGLEVQLESFLSFWIEKEIESEGQKKIWNSLLVNLCDISFGPIPLFFLTHAIDKTIKSGNTLSSETVFKMEDFCNNRLRCQEPLLKCATQCHLLHMILNCSSASRVFKDPLEAVQFLSKFHGERKVLVPEGQLWKLSFSWLQDSFDLEETLNLSSSLAVIKTDDRRNLAFLMALTGQSSEEDLENCSLIMHIKSELSDSHSRPYHAERLNFLLFLSDLCQILRPSKCREGRDYLFYGSSLPLEADRFLSADENLAPAVLMALEQSTHTEHFFQLLDLLFRCVLSHEFVSSFLKLNIEKMEAGGDAVTYHRSLATLAKAVKHPLYKHEIVANFNNFEALLNHDHEKCIENRIMEAIAYKKWLVVDCVSKSQSEFYSVENATTLISYAEDSISTGIGSSLPSIFSVIQTCLEIVSLEEKDLSSLFELCYSSTFELRKNDLFWPAISHFIAMLFSDKLLVNEALRSLQKQYFKSLMKEAQLISGIAPILAKRLFEGSIAVGTVPEWLQDCVGELVMFGPLHRRDQRLVMEVNVMVSGMGKSLDANLVEGSDHLSDTKVRIYSNLMLMKFFRSLPQEQLVDKLVEHMTEISDQKIRYFENSLIHLAKNRLLQTFLLLSDSYEESAALKVIQILLQTLKEESLQNSLKRYSEWIVIVLVRRFQKECWPKLLESYEEAKVTRLGSIPSFLSIFFGLGKAEKESSELDKIMNILSPWCMSQHFGTRLCAQICLKQLYLKGSAMNAVFFVSKYKFLLDCIDQCVKMGNCEKNLLKLDEDFFLNKFDPDENFNLHDILFEFPRLSGILTEEWSHVKTVIDNVKDLSDDFPVCNPKSSLRLIANKVETTTLNPKNNSGLSQEEDQIIQKKIIPWESMIQDLVSIEEVENDQKVAFPNLVLVASLINKLPNLGGLCRTCEIFGVGEYVIANKKLSEEREFRNISMTAHQWVPISEVPANNIKDFLSLKREQGFTVIAIEQTSNSKSLEKFSFPEKSVLLLGNEKEGIPVELIQEVDCCVEIPQKGLIRSFNVHVTGAIALWEYVRSRQSSTK